jgi:16S rRNA (guanine966-N2)-methyltransferase
MRIIAGKFKSRTLIAPSGSETRPTTDRARESLFNVLNNLLDFEGIRVLDLFAGSGALGLEAISRGASHATMVEKDRKAFEAIQKNVTAFGVVKETSVLKIDVFTKLSTLVGPFGLVLADAPYAELRSLAELPQDILALNLLDPAGVLVIEHSSKLGVQVPIGFRLLRRLDLGEASFSLIGYSAE